MNSRTLLIALAISSATADRLSTWLGDGCRNARLATYEPVEVGQCIDLGQAQSYLLDMNEGDTYEIYGGNDCSIYEGEVTLSDTCLTRGNLISSIMNIGSGRDRLKIRGTTQPLAKKSANTLSIRQEGESYQCPNIPSGIAYFLVVTETSAVEEEIGDRDEQTMQNDFMAQFNAAYQNPGGQTQVSSYTPYDGEEFEDVTITLDMVDGVVQDFQDRDMDAIVESVFDFRDQQLSPINFFVSIYSGLIGQGGRPLAEFRFRGD